MDIASRAGHEDVFTLTGRKHESSREIVERNLVQVVLRWERLASLLWISKSCHQVKML